MLNPSSPVQHEIVRSALDWWIDAGVDTLVDETPVPWLARGKAKIAAQPAAAPVQKTAATLHELTAQLAIHSALDAFSSPAQRIVASGNHQADLMVMIDMPETDDAATGTLISGEAGALFEKMLAAIALDRAQCYIAAYCPARLPGGSIPGELIDPLSDFARRHVALAAPKKLWIMGMAASRALIGADAVFGQGRKRLINYEGSTVEAVASFSPRMLLQQPKRKAAAWADMQALMRGLDA
jgi:uracil-DNA glycosylase